MSEQTKASSATPSEPQRLEIASTSNKNGTSETTSITASKKINKLTLSFITCVLLPLLILVIYYGVIATDRYAAKAGFSIRGIETSQGIDGLGALTGLASAGSTTADSYIVLHYLESRALVEELDAKLNLKQQYSADSIDSFSRINADISIEDFVAYWQKRIHVNFDPSSGIIEAEVQSFSPEHATQIAELLLQSTQALVNQLSANARQDALKFAEDELNRQEQRLRLALEAIRDFRVSEKSVDPSASAALDIQLLATLEAQLIDINARIAVQQATLDNNAPSLKSLTRKAQALATQISERREEITGQINTEGDASTISIQLARYESLDVERRFAEQAYASAMSSLEQARRDADSQQRYLAIHLHPQQAETAEYPKRLKNILVMGFFLFAAWAIGTLLVYSVRDHMQ